MILDDGSPATTQVSETGTNLDAARLTAVQLRHGVQIIDVEHCRLVEPVADGGGYLS